MKSVQEKISEILKESCQADKPDFSDNAIMLFSGQHGIQYTVRIFPDGLVTVDVVQYIHGVSEDKILNRMVSSVQHHHIQKRIKRKILNSCFKYVRHVSIKTLPINI